MCAKTHPVRKRKAIVPDQQLHSRVTRVAVIGNYIPRRCGIATFATDLAESLAAEAPESEVWAAAMNDTPDGYPYPSRVHFEMSEQSRGDYRLAAEFPGLPGTPLARFPVVGNGRDPSATKGLMPSMLGFGD
jgi:hypothetical protein